MFEEKTPEAIKEAILAGLKGDIDKREGSFADDMAGPVAVELFKMYQTLGSLVPMFYVDETSGEYVDKQAAYWGITRKPGEKARAKLAVDGKDGTAVPAGTVFLSDEGVRFQSTEDAVIWDGAATVSVLAEAPGEAGNLGPGRIIRMEKSIPGVTGVQNPEGAQGGVDEESTEKLLERLSIARRKPRTSGNIHDYEAWALETPGVGAVKVFPLYNGPGSVKIVAADDEMQPVDEPVLAACREIIHREHPIGVKDLQVESVQGLPVSISARVETENNAAIADLLPVIEKALEEYLKALSFRKQEVLYNRLLLVLLSAPGVKDCTELLVNGGTENIELMENQVPVPGEVTLSEAK